MRQPRKNQTWERNDTGGMSRVITLPEMDIEGDPNAVLTNEHTIDLATIPIEGRRERGVSTGVGRDNAGRSRMVPDWVPEWAITAAGQPVRNDRSGVVEYEVPEWAAELLADSEGQMPTSMVGAGAEMLSNVVPGRAQYRQFTGVEPSREARTINPLSATMGAADAASLGFMDEIAGAVDADTGRELADARRYSQRQDPGSFAIGEAVGTAPQMLLPGAAQGRGATTAARAGLGAAEGAGWGLLEGIGRSDADTLGGRLQDAAPGALLGGVAGGAMAGRASQMEQQAAMPVDEDAVARLMSDANLEWASQAGAAQSRKRMRQLLGGNADRQIENADFVGEQMRSLGVTQPRARGLLPPTQQQMQDRFAAAGTEANGRIRETIARMDGEAPVELESMLGPLRERLTLLERTPGGSTAATQLRQRIGEFERLGTPIVDAQGVTTGYEPPQLSFAELQRMKRYLYANTGLDVNSESERTRVYEALRDRMQTAVDDVDPALGSQYRQDRRTSSSARRMEAMQSDDRLQDAVNRRFSPTDYAMMATGLGGSGTLAAMAGDATASGGTGLAMLGGAIATGAANRAWRANEHGLNARRLERAAERLRTAPQRFGTWGPRLQAAQARGPRAFAAALYTAAQSDEAVRAAMNEDDERQAMEASAIEALPEVQFDDLDTTDLPEVSFDDLDALLGDQP